jgi:hypothetical protein
LKEERTSDPEVPAGSPFAPACKLGASPTRMRQAAANRSSLRSASLPLRLIIVRAKLVLSSLTLADATPQALIEIKPSTLSAPAGVAPDVTAASARRWSAVSSRPGPEQADLVPGPRRRRGMSRASKPVRALTSRRTGPAGPPRAPSGGAAGRLGSARVMSRRRSEIRSRADPQAKRSALPAAILTTITRPRARTAHWRSMQQDTI